MQRPDQGPGVFTWLIAFISLLLPWVGAITGIFGLWQVVQGERTGWWYAIAGGVLLIADILIDFVWAHPSVLKTDQPDLNRRPDQIVGRVVVIEEAITHGRGKARLGDTLWIVEGPDAPAGAHMRVTAAHGAVLRVEMT